jgi:DNA helicase-2/ATP-dependent DNA helicase PcrA
VFLAGLSDGLLPTALADTDATVAEERRLLYVGITRAREHLQLSYARARLPGSRPTRSMSRFLVELWPDGRSRTGRGRAVPGGHAAADADPVTRETAERLTRWRDDYAHATGVPAVRVLTTATIAEVARRRPASREELGRVRGIGAVTLATVGDEILDVVVRASARS